MDFDSIKTVILVAKLKSFSQASFELPCAQSTVSRRIKQVEDDLNVQIFTRPTSKGNVSLTVEGEKIIPIFQSIVADYERLRRLPCGEQGITNISLAIPGRTMLSPMGVHNLNTRFCLRHPNIEFLIFDSSETDMVERLEINRLDAALLPQYNWKNVEPFTYLECNKVLKTHRVGAQQIHVAVSELSPLASRESLRMADLQELSFLYTRDIRTMPASQLLPNHLMFLEACRRSHFTPNIALMDNKNRSIRYCLVKQGVGAMLCALTKSMREYDGIKYLPVTDCPMYAEWYVITRKDVDPFISQTMVRFFREIFSEEGYDPTIQQTEG
ncbi:MAG: LysR family transcriptional regulator [Clostridiales bacterium]|nr:LysR family transcriptional regulator [Clostridiales bacterium]